MFGSLIWRKKCNPIRSF